MSLDPDPLTLNPGPLITPEIRALFWWVPEDKKEKLSLEAVVEAVLNYGNEKMVARLIDYAGINHIARIFYQQTSRPGRINYHPRTVHFFHEYFQRHAKGYPDSESA